MRRNHLTLGAALAAVATASTLAIATTGSAKSGGTTLSFVAHFGGPTNFVDNPPKTRGLNPGPGDLLTATSTVFDSSGKTRVGRTSELCIGTVKQPFTMQCDISLLLHNGTLVIAGAINPPKHPWSAPVVGGTGAYAGARGTVRDTAVGGHNERLTITLAP
ncbi:MAG: Dirigent-like protein [Thermoleophilaceae bacterium]|jgi:hypothetical protein|nr:Dirigent-like protein [Thermoleophilaceae bacterium]